MGSKANGPMMILETTLLSALPGGQWTGSLRSLNLLITNLPGPTVLLSFDNYGCKLLPTLIALLKLHASNTRFLPCLAQALLFCHSTLAHEVSSTWDTFLPQSFSGKLILMLKDSAQTRPSIIF